MHGMLEEEQSLLRNNRQPHTSGIKQILAPYTLHKSGQLALILSYGSPEAFIKQFYKNITASRKTLKKIIKNNDADYPTVTESMARALLADKRINKYRFIHNFYNFFNKLFILSFSSIVPYFSLAFLFYTSAWDKGAQQREELGWTDLLSLKCKDGESYSVICEGLPQIYPVSAGYSSDCVGNNDLNRRCITPIASTSWLWFQGIAVSTLLFSQILGNGIAKFAESDRTKHTLRIFLNILTLAFVSLLTTLMTKNSSEVDNGLQAQYVFGFVNNLCNAASIDSPNSLVFSGETNNFFIECGTNFFDTSFFSVITSFKMQAIFWSIYVLATLGPLFFLESPSAKEKREKAVKECFIEKRLACSTATP